MKQLLYIVFLLQYGFVISQHTFHKIYNFDTVQSMAHGVYPTDSCYYFGAMETFGSETDVLFGKLNLEGELEYYNRHETPGDIDGSVFSWTGLPKDHNGNFVFGYNRRVYGGYSHPLILLMDSQGEVQDSYYYLHNGDGDSTRTYDNGKVLYCKTDSSYFGVYTFRDFHNVNPEPTEMILFKLDKNLDSLWTKKLYLPGTADYLARGAVQKSDNSILLSPVGLGGGATLHRVRPKWQSTKLSSISWLRRCFWKRS